MDSGRRIQAVEILKRTWQTLWPVWLEYQREHGRTRNGYRYDVLIPKIDDICDVRTWHTGHYYYEISRYEAVWPDNGTPYNETNMYTIGYRLILRKQSVYRSGLRRVRSDRSRCPVDVLVRWHGEPLLAAPPRHEYPATADGWQRLIADHDFQRHD